MPKGQYVLNSANEKAARARGLVDAEWYLPQVTRKQLRDLARRSDGPALCDTVLWFAALALSGWLAWMAWGSWWAIPAFAVYGIFYASAADSRAHEAGHGTPFASGWMNDVLFEVASFMVLRESTRWRWSHARHHTDTIIVGRDPEIAAPRPPDIVGMVLNIVNLKSGLSELRRVLLHATGRLTQAERDFIPNGQERSVFKVARVYVAIWVTIIAISVATGSVLPLLYVGLPSFYGAPLQHIFALTQHSGLQENVLDHRLNTRTVLMNPFFRFIYSNMNYHIEHHMFPMVPYHALPKLHEVLKREMPLPYPSLLSAYREILPALLRQRRDPSYYIERSLGASPADGTAGGAAEGPIKLSLCVGESLE